MAEEFTICVCPICERQVSEDPEMGEACSHPRFGYVEAIELEVAPPATLKAATGLARFRLEQEQREDDFRTASERWFNRLPEEERQRIREERYAKLPHHQRSRAEFQDGMNDNLRRMLESTPLSILGATSGQRAVQSDS